VILSLLLHLFKDFIQLKGHFKNDNFFITYKLFELYHIDKKALCENDQVLLVAFYFKFEDFFFFKN